MTAKEYRIETLDLLRKDIAEDIENPLERFILLSTIDCVENWPDLDGDRVMDNTDEEATRLAENLTMVEMAVREVCNV